MEYNKHQLLLFLLLYHTTELSKYHDEYKKNNILFNRLNYETHRLFVDFIEHELELE